MDGLSIMFIKWMLIMGYPPNHPFIVFIMENTIKMDDLGVPWGTPISGTPHVFSKN
jgi:hypothetical protein